MGVGGSQFCFSAVSLLWVLQWPCSGETVQLESGTDAHKIAEDHLADHVAHPVACCTVAALAGLSPHPFHRPLCLYWGESILAASAVSYRQISTTDWAAELKGRNFGERTQWEPFPLALACFR